MWLTQKAFDKKFQQNQLKIALIGMSNIGKSLRAKQLKLKKNFTSYCVDKHIANSLGMKNEAEMATWLGYPYEDQFQTHQAIYLEHEGRLTQNAQAPKNQNFVLDTTGSVIYLAPDILESLKNEYLLVYLLAPADKVEQMTENYFLNPKPVIWGDSFQPHEGEDDHASLRRCYPELLAYRQKKYKALADITLDIYQDPPLPFEAFWNQLRHKLPAEEDFV